MPSIVPDLVKHAIIIISIFLAPIKRQDNLPITTVITAPETIYAVITQETVMDGVDIENLVVC